MFRSLLLALIFTINIFSQQLPITFSDNNHSFIGFSGSSFATRGNPVDAANIVGQFHNNGLDANQGFYIDLASPIDLSIQNKLTLSFYAFDPNNHTVTLKLESGGTNNDVEITTNINGAANTWQENILFDFDSNTGSYNRLTIFIDKGVLTPGTYLIDDINNGSSAQNPYELDVIYDVLAWSDEFDSGTNPQTINFSNWHHQTQIPAGGNWYNNEVQHYTNRLENSFMQNGMLHIRAKKENFTDQGYTKQYTSARLNSKFAFTYGRVDVRAKLPSGNGTWPAIWTLGKNINEDGGFWDNQFGNTGWPACGEIDIMEHGLHATNEVSCAIHTPSSFGNTVNTKKYLLNDVANNFHVYSVNWSPYQIIFMIDGVGYYKYNPSNKNNSTWPFNVDQYLLLNIAMGGFAGTIDSNFTQSDMVIDYVRVYQNASILNTLSFDNQNDIKIFPNPAKSIINVVSSSIIKNMMIIDVKGQQIAKYQPNQTNYQVKVDKFAKGIYFFKINDEKLSSYKKIIIE